MRPPDVNPLDPAPATGERKPDAAPDQILPLFSCGAWTSLEQVDAAEFARGSGLVLCLALLLAFPLFFLCQG